MQSFFPKSVWGMVLALGLGTPAWANDFLMEKNTGPVNGLQLGVFGQNTELSNTDLGSGLSFSVRNVFFRSEGNTDEAGWFRMDFGDVNLVVDTYSQDPTGFSSTQLRSLKVALMNLIAESEPDEANPEVGDHRIQGNLFRLVYDGPNGTARAVTLEAIGGEGRIEVTDLGERKKPVSQKALRLILSLNYGVGLSRVELQNKALGIVNSLGRLQDTCPECFVNAKPAYGFGASIGAAGRLKIFNTVDILAQYDYRKSNAWFKNQQSRGTQTYEVSVDLARVIKPLRLNPSTRVDLMAGLSKQAVTTQWSLGEELFKGNENYKTYYWGVRFSPKGLR